MTTGFPLTGVGGPRYKDLEYFIYLNQNYIKTVFYKLNQNQIKIVWNQTNQIKSNQSILNLAKSNQINLIVIRSESN